MKVAVKLVKAFTQDPAQGNPAAVVLDADSLDAGQMLAIAQHYGFSESAFVQTSVKADFRIRFFTVRQEVDFCGHATVATFYALAQAGNLAGTPKTVTQETGIGVLPVSYYPDGKLMMAQNQPLFGGILDREEVARLLGLEEADLDEAPIQVVSTGVKKLVVPVKSLRVLRSIQPGLRAIVTHSTQHSYSGVAPIARESFTGGADLVARSFNPRVGISEDSATGIAAGPIACYANKYLFIKPKQQVVIEQGFDMGKGSTLYVDLADGVKVGGYATGFGAEELDLDNL